MVTELDSPLLDSPIDARALSKLRWRCRRGLLENDLILARFFDRAGSHISNRQEKALLALMDLSDNDLLDLNLGRKSLVQMDASVNTTDVQSMLNLLKITR